MIPIVNFYALIKKPNSMQLAQIRKWFWQCSLTLRYKAGTNRLVLEDLGKIKKLLKAILLLMIITHQLNLSCLVALGE